MPTKQYDGKTIAIHSDTLLIDIKKFVFQYLFCKKKGLFSVEQQGLTFRIKYVGTAASTVHKRKRIHHISLFSYPARKNSHEFLIEMNALTFMIFGATVPFALVDVYYTV